MTLVPCLLLASVCAADPGLEASLAPLARKHQGKVAIAVKHLTTGESYYLNADEPMPTASLIKLPILIEAYLQAGEKKIKLTDRITLHQDDKVPGSGLLTTNFSEGTTFPLRDALHLMIAHSDNTATNLVLDRVGIAAVNQRMAAWGLKETRLNAKVFRGSTTSVDPARTRKYGLGSTTAREMVTLLELLQMSQKVPPAAKQCILGHLRRCEDREKFPRFLPTTVDLAHKTGSVNQARTDAGLLYLDRGAVALCVLSAENKDQSWRAENAGNRLCAEVARIVYRHFSHLDSEPSPSRPR